MSISLDFTVVTFSEARRALNEAPPGIATFSPKKELMVRLPPRPEDHALLPATVAWLSTIPPELRPINCARYYPRIANRIHKLWGAPLFLKDYLEDLVIAKRTGRSGFPHGITGELERLRGYYLQEHPDGVHCPWAANFGN